MRRWYGTFLVAVVLGAPVCAAGAQIVRGVVTERASTSAVSGVLVSLERSAAADSPGQVVTSALTNERGEFALRAPAAGTYRVSAKRIGVRRFSSEHFDLSNGETKRLDIALETVTFVLPEVVVAATSLCLSRPNQAQRLASLWDEARTALTATRISLRDRLFRGRVARYVRELDPKNMRVLSESRADMQGILDRPFTSLSGDSLSKMGYWRSLPDGSSIYNAPDAEVLMSDAFLRDHCFAAIEGGRDRRGMVGIAFEPGRDRRLPDVRGTLWLDARTFELRLVDFRYTHLQTSGDSTRVGGEVHFARLKSGAWVVRRWFIRMPQFAHFANSPVGVDPRMPTVLVRPGIYRLIEEGGDVFAEGIRLFEKPATIAGVVLDSAAMPFAGATVRLAGTPFTATTDPQGRFRIDSLPAGTHTLLANHASYSALGVAVADAALSLEEGEMHRVTLRALGTEEIVSRLCDGKVLQKKRATLRLTMLDADREAPLGAMPVWVHWAEPSASAADPDSARYPGMRSTTDARGVVMFCDLPGGVPIEVELLRSDERTVHVTQFLLAPSEVAARTVKARRPR